MVHCVIFIVFLKLMHHSISMRNITSLYKKFKAEVSLKTDLFFLL